MKSRLNNHFIKIIFINITWFEPDCRNIAKAIVYRADAETVFRDIFMEGKVYGTFCGKLSQLDYRLINCKILFSLYDVLTGRNICILSADWNMGIRVITADGINYTGSNSIVSADNCIWKSVAFKNANHFLL